MKRFLQPFLISISLFVILGCANTRHLTRQKTNTAFVVSPPLHRQFSTALYKAKITLGKKKFSGLFYFKNLPDSSIRILFLSEFGLNLLDLEYKNHFFTVKNCKDFLNKKMVIKTFEKNIRMLIDTPQKVKHRFYNDDNGNIALVILKKQFKKYYYFYPTNATTIKKIIATNRLSKASVDIQQRQDMPAVINIKNNIIDLNINLTLIKQK